MRVESAEDGGRRTVDGGWTADNGLRTTDDREQRTDDGPFLNAEKLTC